MFATSKHEHQNRFTVLPVVYLVSEAQSVTPTKIVGCGVSVKCAGKTLGLVWEELTVNWGHCVMNSSTLCTYWGKQIKKNEMDRVCGTNEGKRSSYGNLGEKT